MVLSNLSVSTQEDLIMEISDIVFKTAPMGDDDFLAGDVMTFADIVRLRQLVEELEWRVVVKPVLTGQAAEDAVPELTSR